MTRDPMNPPSDPLSVSTDNVSQGRPLATVTLNDGSTMPPLGLGVYKTPADQTADIVRSAVRIGYRMVDTAKIYGNETGVGEALAGHPDIFVVTKLWTEDMGYEPALRAFETSARKLKRDVIDLYLIHWPMPRKDLYVDSWKALVRLQREGRVRSIGVSNFEPEHIDRLVKETGVVPAVNQIELHPVFQQKALCAYHQSKGIVTQAWSPLGRGSCFENETIKRLAETHGKTPAQIVLRWHLQLGHVVIPKSAQPKRLEENFNMFDFALSQNDMDQMLRLDREDGRTGPHPLTADF